MKRKRPSKVFSCAKHNCEIHGSFENKQCDGKLMFDHGIQYSPHQGGEANQTPWENEHMTQPTSENGAGVQCDVTIFFFYSHQRLFKLARKCNISIKWRCVRGAAESRRRVQIVRKQSGRCVHQTTQHQFDSIPLHRVRPPENILYINSERKHTDTQ